ncbi:hypothetical protein [Lignipirellula cremea]|uniref:Uncharacterized protein n=1 Tax=Lignipirellula cremea TaxID=2528010 RepID=A0A518DYC9_9BACT|nr:hypothetical protein [Lignipirellula cremea]QDU96848.1 hypothetical protein Pla8534_46700 [Lignipirellula cremea]
MTTPPKPETDARNEQAKLVEAFAKKVGGAERAKEILDSLQALRDKAA